MCRKITNRISRTASHVSSALDRFRADDPLLVRRKFQMKDVCYRKDCPEAELFRWEIAWDAEFTVLLLVLAAAAALFLLKTARLCRRFAGRKKCRKK